MKKLIFALLLLPATLCSCKSNSNKNYKVTKKVFEHELNPHTVMFEANYQLDIVAFGEHQKNEFDCGTIRVNENYIFHFDDLGDHIRWKQYENDGTPYYTMTDTCETIYRYWFGKLYYLFFLTYEDFTFDEKEKQYVCGRVEYSKDLVVSRGIFKSYNNKPMYIEFELEGYGTYYSTFSKHGEVTVTI